jgi:hypothetical protein
MAVGQLEQMIGGPGQKFTRYAVCCQHARDLGQDFKATLKQAGSCLEVGGNLKAA